MNELVHIRQHALPEARRTRELRAALFTMHHVGLPAVIVRASGLADTGARSHDEITQTVREILLDNPELNWIPSGEGRTDSLPATVKGRGDLHHDSRLGVFGLIRKFHVQRTGSGCGKVWMAMAGEFGFEYDSQPEEEADSNFQKGRVDPRLISPDFYVAELETDDKVIFPVSLPFDHNKAGPIWHAFDTSSESRYGTIQTIPLADYGPACQESVGY